MLPTEPAAGTRRPALARIAGGLPDAVVALFFWLLWTSPQTLWPGALRTGLLMMLVEFVLLHAAAIIGGIVMVRLVQQRPISYAWLLWPVSFYLLFIAIWSWQFRAWWPLLALAWLLASKLWMALQPIPPADKLARMHSDWGIGVLAYLTGAAVTVFLPIPRLGLSHRVVSEADLSSGGLWVDQPQTVVAFGLFYFSIMALARWCDWRLPGTGKLPAQPVG